MSNIKNLPSDQPETENMKTAAPADKHETAIIDPSQQVDLSLQGTKPDSKIKICPSSVPHFGINEKIPVPNERSMTDNDQPDSPPPCEENEDVTKGIVDEQSGGVFNTLPKNGKRQNRNHHLTQLKQAQRIANSMLFYKEEKELIMSLFQGSLAHMSFDIPLNLRNALNKSCANNGTSTCKILQQLSVAFVIADIGKKQAKDNTLGVSEAKPSTEPSVVIKAMNISQYTQTRPRRLVRTGDDKVKNKDGNFVEECKIGNCHKPSVGCLIHITSGKEYLVCKQHLRLAQEHPRTWKVTT